MHLIGLLTLSYRCNFGSNFQENSCQKSKGKDAMSTSRPGVQDADKQHNLLVIFTPKFKM